MADKKRMICFLTLIGTRCMERCLKDECPLWEEKVEKCSLVQVIRDLKYHPGRI